MKKYLRYLLIQIALASAPGLALAQQDPIFTQYMFNQQAINPSYAGIWDKIGFYTMVRKQWAGIQRSPLTEMISFHMPLKNKSVGLGLNIIGDQFSRERRLSVFGDYAFEVLLTPEVRMRMGIKFGFTNFQNPLTDYKLYPDGIYDPAFGEDVQIDFMPNFGVGTFIYSEKFFFSLGIPRLIQNTFKANYNNYSSLAEARNLYVSGGYVFDIMRYLKFKPTALVRASIGVPVQAELAGNLCINERMWVGLMYRTGSSLCAIVQWQFDNNLRIGYAMDFAFTEIYKYQNGTYEFTISYDIDFYGRSYMRHKYF